MGYQIDDQRIFINKEILQEVKRLSDNLGKLQKEQRDGTELIIKQLSSLESRLDALEGKVGGLEDKVKNISSTNKYLTKEKVNPKKT